MEKPLSLTILYTANLRGDIASLPRLFTLLQQLKAEPAGATLILDLGNACDDAAWHCYETGGRSMLIVLDGMGYHAANVACALAATDRGKLAAQVTMALVDETHPLPVHLPSYDKPIVATLQPDNTESLLQVQMSPGACSEIVGNTLRLQATCGRQIGAVELRLRPAPEIAHIEIHDLPANTPPNPTIAGAVDFVEAEARLFQQKRMRDR